jgi:hypothetical protein
MLRLKASDCPPPEVVSPACGLDGLIFDDKV